MKRPTQIRLRRRSGVLELHYGKKECYRLDSEYLRVFSPSAEVHGHQKGQFNPPSNTQDVAISNLEPVGNYSVRLIFDDGHDSGIYSWDWLYDLATNEAHNRKKWKDKIESEK